MSKRYSSQNLSVVPRPDSMEDSLRSEIRHDWHYGRTPLSRPRQAVLVAILLLGLLLSSLDASIVSTSLVRISVELRDFLNSPWVALSYLLAYLGFAVLFAKLSDIFGRSTLLAVAWSLFTVFSLCCGLATNMPSLIVFRAFQGIGGSGLYSLAQIGLFEVGPSRKPSLLGALIGMTLAVSFVLGPVLGGTITRFVAWRWIFYINIPFGILALIGIFFAWPQRINAIMPRPWVILQRIDPLGNILIISASSLLVYSLQQAGAFNYSWSDPVIVTTMSMAAICWICFIGWEIYLGYWQNHDIQPVIPLRLVTQRPFLAVLGCSFFAGFGYLAVIIILPERFQIVNGDDPLMAGVHLLPLLGACAFGSFLAGAVSSRRNNTSVTLVVASGLQVIGVGLLSTMVNVLAPIEAQYGYQTIFGLGIGLSFASVTISTSVRAHPEDLAVAQGAIAQARVFGGAIGIAVCMIIINAQFKTDLSSFLTADIEALYHNPLNAQYFPPDKLEMIKATYAKAFSRDIKVMIGISVLGLIVSFFSIEANPPPMPSHLAAKPSAGVGVDQSETELNDMTRFR